MIYLKNWCSRSSRRFRRQSKTKSKKEAIWQWYQWSCLVRVRSEQTRYSYGWFTVGLESCYGFSKCNGNICWSLGCGQCDTGEYFFTNEFLRSSEKFVKVREKSSSVKTAQTHNEWAEWAAQGHAKKKDKRCCQKNLPNVPFTPEIIRWEFHSREVRKKYCYID